MLVIFASFALLAFVAVVTLVCDGFRDNLGNADVGIVLGNEVLADGRPSPRLRARLDKAAALYRDGWFPEVIVSGGVSDSGFDEATVMQRYLVACGVPAEDVHADSAGVNTYMTAKNAAAWMRARGLERACVVSQFYHTPRARLAHRRFGIPAVYSAHANYLELHDLYATARELPAYLFYFLRPYR